MRLNRIYQSQNLSEGLTLILDKAASQHLAKVLRISVNTEIELFNGNGNRYQAKIVSVERNSVSATITKALTVANESPLNIHLFQGIKFDQRGLHWDIL